MSEVNFPYKNFSAGQETITGVLVVVVDGFTNIWHGAS